MSARGDRPTPSPWAANGTRRHRHGDQSSDASVRAYNLVWQPVHPGRGRVRRPRPSATPSRSTATAGLGPEPGHSTSARPATSSRPTTSANAGNAWDLAGRARATANQAVLANQGGSVVRRDPSQDNTVLRPLGRRATTAYDYGAAEAYAAGAGNERLGRQQRHLSSRSTTPRSTPAASRSRPTFSGTNGYDVYVGADAVGNSVTGYACSDCQGDAERHQHPDQHRQRLAPVANTDRRRLGPRGRSPAPTPSGN